MKYGPYNYDILPKEDFILYYVCDETNGKYTIRKFMADGSIKCENYDSEASFESAKDRYNSIMEEQVRKSNEKLKEDKVTKIAIMIGPSALVGFGSIGSAAAVSQSFSVFATSVLLGITTLGIPAFRQSLILIDDINKNKFFLSNKRRINKALLFNLEDDMLFNNEDVIFSKDADRIVNERRTKGEPLSINDVEFFSLKDLETIIKVQEEYQEKYDLFIDTIVMLDPLFVEPEFSKYFDDYEHERIFKGLSEKAYHKIKTNFAREIVLTEGDINSFTDDDIIKLHVMALSIKEEYEKIKEAKGPAKKMKEPKIPFN